MRILTLIYWLALGSAWTAQAAEIKKFELNGQDTLTISVASAIRIRLEPAESGQPAHLILSDTNKICEVRMVLAKTAVKLSDEQIKSQLLDAGKKLMSAVVEKEITVRKLGGNAFTYFYFELTDSRPGPLQGSRYVLQGLGRGSGYVCEFVMLMNRKSSDEEDQIMSSLRSIDIRAKK